MKLEKNTKDNITDDVVRSMAKLYWTDFVETKLRDKNPEFYSEERFIDRVYNNYMNAPGFQAITLWMESDLIGFATAANLRTNTVWWDGVEPPRPSDKALEDGKTTIAIFDVLVAMEQRGNGFATKMHHTLIKEAEVKRSTLLSSKPQQPAYDIWLHLGYDVVGKKQMEDGPLLDVFLLTLD